MSTPPPVGSGRWTRLAADLAAAGVPVTVDERPYTEAVYGRVSSGVSRSITIRQPGGGTVEVSDAWWPKNPDKWTGWVVTRTAADDIVCGRPARSKKRSETVAAVTAAIAEAQADEIAGAAQLARTESGACDR